jgi:hypothetical protein
MDETDLVSVTAVLQGSHRLLLKFPQSATVADLELALANDSSVEVPLHSRCFLVFRGRILDYADILSSLDPSNDFCVHVLYKEQPEPIPERETIPGLPLDAEGLFGLRHLNFAQADAVPFLQAPFQDGERPELAVLGAICFFCLGLVSGWISFVVFAFLVPLRPSFRRAFVMGFALTFVVGIIFPHPPPTPPVS